MGRGEEASQERRKMNGEREREGEGEQRAKRARARGACGHGSRFFWTQHIFQCPSTAILIFPLARLPPFLLALSGSSFLRVLARLLRLRRAFATFCRRSPTTDSSFYRAIAKNERHRCISALAGALENRESESLSGQCRRAQTSLNSRGRTNCFYMVTSSEIELNTTFIKLYKIFI